MKRAHKTRDGDGGPLVYTLFPCSTLGEAFVRLALLARGFGTNCFQAPLVGQLQFLGCRGEDQVIRWPCVLVGPGPARFYHCKSRVLGKPSQQADQGELVT